MKQGRIVKPYALGRRNSNNFDIVDKAESVVQRLKAVSDLLLLAVSTEQAITSVPVSPSRRGNTCISEITEVLQRTSDLDCKW